MNSNKTKHLFSFKCQWNLNPQSNIRLDEVNSTMKSYKIQLELKAICLKSFLVCEEINPSAFYLNSKETDCAIYRKMDLQQMY